jgi:hypothetical protein
LEQTLNAMGLFFHIGKPLLVLLALLAWWRMRSRFEPGAHLLGLHLLLAFVAEAAGSATAEMGVRNLWVYDLYVPLEFVLLWAYVRAQLGVSSNPWAWWAGLVVVVAAYAVELATAFPDAFASRAYILGSALLAGGLLLVLYRLAKGADRPLLRQPVFWSHFGMAIFFVGMIPVLGMWNMLTSVDRETSETLYTFNHVLFAARYGGVLVACAVRTH